MTANQYRFLLGVMKMFSNSFVVTIAQLRIYLKTLNYTFNKAVNK